jgi:membrane-bound serine protease (ClpP class)
MDFLLDPNIAYLVLVTGILLTFLAVVTPGTGMLELSAFFCLMLAGYSVYNQTFNWWALVILGLSLLPFMYAIQKPKREFFLGLSILLLVAGSAFLFVQKDWKPAVNPLIAVVTSTLAAGFLWIAVRKTLQAMRSKPSHDLELLVGQLGESRTDIRNEGSVQVAGELWSARSAESIPAKCRIKVVGREGFILVVEKNG